MVTTLLSLVACFLITDGDHAQRVDADGDGVIALAYGGDDCDDADGAVHPGAEDPCDGADQDCDGEVDEDGEEKATWYADTDADGYGDAAASVEACAAPAAYVADGRDCNDHDDDVHPNAEESCEATEDLNCDGQFGPVDHDGDGFAACEECDDADAGVFPGAEERCNGKDDDCEGTADEGAADASLWYTDADGDGYGAEEAGTLACEAPPGTVATTGDCEDGEAGTNPGVDETCSDTVDRNCDGAVGDADGDGDGAKACDDCDDSDAAVFPGAVEVCDNVDNDCDGEVDGDAVDRPRWYADVDGDGYGDAAATTLSCTRPVDSVPNDTDCNDADAAVNPGAVEVCDTVDNDCSGDSDTDAVDASTWYADADGDGFGDVAVATLSCDQPIDHVADATDCDDADPTLNPDAVERCDGVDNDCSGDADTDAVDRSSWYTDADGDGFGELASLSLSCDPPAGSVSDSTDCDDADNATYPGAAPYDSAIACETDADGDGYGDTTAPSGGAGGSDCDDTRAAVRPGATESCATTYDDDCDGGTNDSGATGCVTYYADGDGDGYGSGASQCTCTAAGLYTAAASTDCDDGRSAVNPAAAESCATSYDDDCDGSTEEIGAVGCTTYYVDGDGDGYGLSTSSACTCSASTTYTATAGTDCDDGDADTFPGAAANDSATACENDDDGDGYGDATVSALYVEGTDLDDDKSTCVTSLADTDGDGYYNCQDRCADVDGDNYGTTNATAAGCTTASGASCAGDAACTGTDLDDAKSTCTTSLTDTDGDGYYNCQDRCADVDGDNYGTTSAAAATCVTNGASGGSTSCAGDAACTSTDVNDAMSTCTTSLTDTDGDGYYNCQDQCADVDGDNYGTTSSAAAACVTNGASGGSTSCAGDSACTSTDLDDAKSTCTTSLTDTDGDGYYNCQDQCADVDGDNYGTTSATAATCVTNGASGGTTTCAGDAACTSTDLDDAKSTCTTSLTDTDGDGYYNCQDRCADVDGDNYGTTSAAAATCVTNGASGGSTSCAGDAACTSADVNDAMSTCTTAGTYIDTDGDGYYDCQDRCDDSDGDNYGTTNTAAASCVTNGASGGSTSCAGDAACTGADCDDTEATVYPGAADTFAANDGLDNDCDDFIDEAGVSFGDVVITEFFGGNTTATYDWVELYNNSGNTIYLSSWTLSLCHDGSSSESAPYLAASCESEVTVTFPASATIADDSYYVVCASTSAFATAADCDLRLTDYDSPAYTTTNDLENAIGGAALDLDGTEIDSVYWWQDSGNDDWPVDSGGVVSSQVTSIQLDAYVLSTATPDPASVNDDYSTSASAPYLDDIWCTAEAGGVTNDWAATFTMVGTPGSANVACP